jgi:UDP:flavonoid glycosyltransferase YjiC (YdhE family)
MKILVTSDPPAGHVRPLLPVVDALLERRHIVHVWTSERALNHFAGRGVEKHLRLASSEERSRVETATANFEALRPIIDRIQPDLLVHEGSERGAELHAAVSGLPSLSVLTSSDSVLKRVVALQHEVLEAASAALGLESAWRSRRHAHPPRVTYLPREYHQPADLHSFAPNIEFRRYRLPGPSSNGRVPTSRRRILVTLGTTDRVPHKEAIERILAHLPLDEIDVEVACPPTLTAELRSQFPSAAILGFTSIVDRLQTVDLVVTHGGANTVTEALFMGVPLFLTPFRGDQFYTAERCASHQVGTVFHWSGTSDDAMAKGVLGALEDRSLRAGAVRMSRMMRALPPLTELVDRVAAELV